MSMEARPSPRRFRTLSERSSLALSCSSRLIGGSVVRGERHLSEKIAQPLGGISRPSAHSGYRIVRRRDLCGEKPFLLDEDERVKEWRFVWLTHQSAGESWSMSNSLLITLTDGFWTRSRLPDTRAQSSVRTIFSLPMPRRCAVNWRSALSRFAQPLSISGWVMPPRKAAA